MTRPNFLRVENLHAHPNEFGSKLLLDHHIQITLEDGSTLIIDGRDPHKNIWFAHAVVSYTTQSPLYFERLHGAKLSWATTSRLADVLVIREEIDHYAICFSGSQLVHEIKKGSDADVRWMKMLEHSLSDESPIFYSKHPLTDQILAVRPKAGPVPATANTVDRTTGRGAGGNTIEKVEASQMYNLVYPKKKIFTWAHRRDCCDDRALVMKREFRKAGYDCDKVYVQSTVKGYLRPRGTRIRWWYHIAPLMIENAFSGRTYYWVIDPCLFPGEGPIEWARWQNQFPDDVGRNGRPGLSRGLDGWFYYPRKALLRNKDIGRDDFEVTESHFQLDYGAVSEKAARDELLRHAAENTTKSAVQGLRRSILA
jgi:hypothetical protein